MRNLFVGSVKKKKHINTTSYNHNYYNTVLINTTLMPVPFIRVASLTPEAWICSTGRYVRTVQYNTMRYAYTYIYNHARRLHLTVFEIIILTATHSTQLFSITLTSRCRWRIHFCGRRTAVSEAKPLPYYGRFRRSEKSCKSMARLPIFDPKKSFEIEAMLQLG